MSRFYDEALRLKSLKYSGAAVRRAVPVFVILRYVAMIFIDWISTPAHMVFNRGLFFALGIKAVPVYIYSSELEIPGQLNIYSPVSANRVIRALSVLRTCYKNRKSQILFLTYDPVLLPLVVLFCRSVFVFEHNTTPEGKTFLKHAIWQRLFFRGITRFAQFPGQFDTLKQLRQNGVFLGSPLMKGVPVEHQGSHPILIAPSVRVEVSELSRHAGTFSEYPIIVRNVALRKAKQVDAGLNLRGVDWICQHRHLPNAKAIIIGTTSPIRGSGWFSEAIRHGIPLIITSPTAQELFEGTYPGYPYLRAQELSTPAELETALARLRSLLADIAPTYTDRYNEGLRRRFFGAIEA